MPWEESFDAGEPTGAKLFDADTDSLRSRVADDDATAAAAADVAFKPNCLAIQTSINEHLAGAGAVPNPS